MISARSGSPWSRWVGSVSDALPGGHLSLDAVVAFVDGELPPVPAGRAGAHVDRCLSCAAEVAAQRQARRRLRAAGLPGAPTSLLSSLRAIPGAPQAVPTDAEPTDAEPASLEPASLEPAGSEPAGPEPAGLEPTGLEPAGPEPAGLGSVRLGIPDTVPPPGRVPRRMHFGLPVVASGVVAGAATVVVLVAPALAGPTEVPVPPATGGPFAATGLTGPDGPSAQPTAAAADIAGRPTGPASAPRGLPGPGTP